MGHLINPISFRIYKSRYWNNIWNLNFNNINYSYINIDDYLTNLIILKFFKNYLNSFEYGIVYLNNRIVRKYNTILYNVYIHDSFYDMMIYKILRKLRGDWRRNKYRKLKFLFLKRIKFKKKLLIRKFNVQKKRMRNFVDFFVKRPIYKKINKLYSYSMLYNQLVLFKYYIFTYKKIRLKISLRKKYKVFFKLFSCFIFKKFISLFWSNIKVILDKVFSYLFICSNNINKIKYHIYNISCISKYWMWTQVVSDYIVIRLSQNFKLGEILTQINRFFYKLYHTYKLIKGYKIQCTGRFSRKQRASLQWKLFYSIKPSTLKSRLHYSMSNIILKYGKCSIKVWIRSTKLSKKRILYKV